MLLFWRRIDDFIHNCSVLSSYRDIFPYIGLKKPLNVKKKIIKKIMRMSRFICKKDSRNKFKTIRK